MSETAPPRLNPGPYRTHEVRWFHPGRVPAPVDAWFDALGDPVSAEARTDRYLPAVGDGVGIKVREGRIETKRRDGTAGPFRAGRVEAEAEVWTKWLFPAEGDPAPAGWVGVRKRRRQRRVGVAGGSCAVEVSEVEVDGETWWSVCFEASGRSAEIRAAALERAGALWLDRDDAPALRAEDEMGYPAWLEGLRP